MMDVEFLTIRCEGPDDHGEEVISLVLGGSHRGGVTEARWCFGGGLSTDIAYDVLKEVRDCLSTMMWNREYSSQGIFLPLT